MKKTTDSPAQTLDARTLSAQSCPVLPYPSGAGGGSMLSRWRRWFAFACLIFFHLASLFVSLLPFSPFLSQAIFNLR